MRGFAILRRDLRFHVDRVAANPASAFVLGLAFAFGWTPCIGPILGAILTLSAAQDSIASGIRLLVAYSLGLGAPFMIAAFFLHGLVGRIKPLRAFGRYLQWIAGAVMISQVASTRTRAAVKPDRGFNSTLPIQNE